MFLPFIRPSVDTNANAIGWTGWLGATIFFFAAWPEVIEALIRFVMSFVSVLLHLSSVKERMPFTTRGMELSDHLYLAKKQLAERRWTR